MKIPLLIVLVSSLILFGLGDRIRAKERASRPVAISAENLKKMTFGYDLLIADSLWLRVIQDYELCESEVVEKSYNPKKKMEEALGVKMTKSRCHKGWAYIMLDAITELDPRFRKAFAFGGVMLSVGVDDREGARLLFEKGVRLFPNYWSLAYQAAYHYLFEVQDAERAADLLLQAHNNGGPVWLPALAARLYDHAGRKALGISVLEEFIKTHPGGEAETRAKKRLEELQHQ